MKVFCLLFLFTKEAPAKSKLSYAKEFRDSLLRSLSAKDLQQMMLSPKIFEEEKPGKCNLVDDGAQQKDEKCFNKLLNLLIQI